MGSGKDGFREALNKYVLEKNQMINQNIKHGIIKYAEAHVEGR